MAEEPNIAISALTPQEKLAFLRDLQEAYFSGVSRVRFMERDVTYRSLQDMKIVMDDLVAETTPKVRPRAASVFTTFSRGY